jgi:hypothetical protein
MLTPSNDSEINCDNYREEEIEYCTDTGEEEIHNEYCIGEVCCEWATIRIPPEEGVDAKYFCQECYSDFYDDTDESDTDKPDDEYSKYHDEMEELDIQQPPLLGGIRIDPQEDHLEVVPKEKETAEPVSKRGFAGFRSGFLIS